MNIKNIKEAKIDWAHGYANSPTLHLVMETKAQFPDYEPIWNYEPDSGMVWAEVDGIIDFIYMGNGMLDEDRKGFKGFGGHTFTRTLTNGTIMVSNDCWSGRAALLPFECIDINVSTDGGHSWGTKAIRIEDFREIITELGFHIVPDYRHQLHEISAFPDRSGKPRIAM